MKTSNFQIKRALYTALLFLLLSVAGITKSFAQEYNYVTIGNLKYHLYVNTLSAIVACHVDGTNATGYLTIPSSVTYTSDEWINGQYVPVTRTYSVIRIGNEAFRGCSGFTGSLTLPNSVTSIGDNAFRDCSGFTGSLTIGNSVTTIGNYAFSYCTGFTGSLTIAASVTSIGWQAFWGCSGFTQVNYNATNCADGYPFEGCGGSLVIGDNVERIPAYMFEYGSFIGTLTIPNSVTSIGQYAFSNCSGFTGGLTIPNSVTSIGNNAFRDCSGFTGSLTIGNSVTSIGDNAFRDCSGFTGSLTIGNSVTSIGQYAFYNCSSFTQVNYNAVNCADLTQGAKPFAGCSGTLTIGNTSQRIPAYMFYKAEGLTGSLTIPNSVTTIGKFAFRDCSGFTGSLIIPSSMTTIGDSAFAGCSGFDGILNIPNSVTTIGLGAFNGCSGFTGSLIIPNSVTSIGDWAFAGCSGFTGSLNLGSSLTSIGAFAFQGCVYLTGSLILPNSLTTIGPSAFKYCSGFTGSLTIPNSVTSIDNEAFYGCTGLTGSMTIGNSVTTIGDRAFSFQCLYSVHFDVITLNTIPPTIGNNPFYGIGGDPVLIVRCGSKDAYVNSEWCNSFSTITEDCYTYTVYVEENGLGSINTSNNSPQLGEEIIVSCSPISGFEMDSIRICNVNNESQLVPVYSISNTECLFVMPNFDVVIKTHFSPLSVGESSEIVPIVYPNPTNGKVRIESESINNVGVYNTLGQNLYEAKVCDNEFEYDFNKHGEGLYLIRIETASGVVTKRVIVINK